MCYLYREQHLTEVSAIEDKVKWLQLELEKTKKSSSESTVHFQSKVGSLKKSCFSALISLISMTLKQITGTFANFFVLG